MPRLGPTLRRLAATLAIMTALSAPSLTWAASDDRAGQAEDQAIHRLALDIQAHHGRLKAADIDRLGRTARTQDTRPRFYGLWRVLNYYYSNADRPDFERWIAITRATAHARSDPQLAALPDLMERGFSNQQKTLSDDEQGFWKTYESGATPDLRRVAQIEQLRSAAYQAHWAEASAIGGALIEDLQKQGPLALPMLAEVHTVLSDSLVDLGDPAGALDHLIEAATINRQIGSMTQDSELVYNLSYNAMLANRLDAAEQLAQLHTRLIRDSGGPNALFFNRFLCASIARARLHYAAALQCLQDIDAKVDSPRSGWAASALALRQWARAKLGDIKGAQADLGRLRRLPGDLEPVNPAEMLYAQALLQHIQGRDSAAFENLDRARVLWINGLDADHQRRVSDISAALRAELQVKRDESARLAKDLELGRRLTFAWTAVALLLALLAIGGGVICVHLKRMSVRLRQARNQADAANAAKSTFLAMISHELRTPLNGMIGITQTLAKEPLTVGQAEQVATLKDSGGVLLALLNDILDLSKVEAGKLEVAPTPGDLVETCAKTLSLYQPMAEQKGLELRLETAGAPARPLNFDPVRVRQCVANLVSNALKFTTAGGVTVSVTSEPFGEHGQARVTLRVSDTGMGMSPETLSRLFGAYAQADATTSHNFGGTGLGLNITRRLAELMGGDVTVTSQEGLGSTFTLTFVSAPLPAVAGAVGEAAAEPPQDKGEGGGGHENEDEDLLARLHGLKVLVVDDHPVNRMVVRLLIEPLGCEVTELGDGASALEHLAKLPFDMVLMDVNMPGMGGLEATRRIRGELGLAGLPIIAFTGETLESQVAECRAAGMNAQVAKPIDADELIATIADLAKAQALLTLAA